MYLLFIFLGLAKLPHPIAPSATIRPTKLPSNCDGVEYEHVYGMGIGKTYEEQPKHEADGLVRQVALEEFPCVMSFELRMDGYANAPSTICTLTTNDQNMANGDSGEANSISIELHK